MHFTKRRGQFAMAALPPIVMLLGATPAAAAEEDSEEPALAETRGSEDIIVQARKRSESALDVPVTLTAIGGEELQRRALTNFDTIARYVPGLIMADDGGSHQGGNVTIRGIAGAENNPLGDQAVSFNIDGVQIAKTSVRRLSAMDVEQVEVLKGPQALFFGGNSPGGIISIRTADPTSRFQAKVTADYEVNAREVRGEGYISGPITDTLGFRIAGLASHMRGWVKNIAPRDAVLPPGQAIFPARRYGPLTDEFALRGTLKWDPSSSFSARLKISHGEVEGDSPSFNTQLIACPLGVPQGSTTIDDCRADDRVAFGNFGPAAGLLKPGLGDGKTFLRSRQTLASLELNYDLSDELHLTSVTGYYQGRQRAFGNFNANYLETQVLPKSMLGGILGSDAKELSQELRLTSDIGGPIEFMFGTYGKWTRAAGGTDGLFRNAINPVSVASWWHSQRGENYSVFGQLIVKPVSTIEFSAGGRYTAEKKRLTHIRQGSAFVEIEDLPEFNGPNISRMRQWDDFSPEVTLSWRPNRDINIYASYRESFMSGGFNSVILNPASSNAYDEQTISGFEGGIKTSLLGGALRANLGLFNYRTEGLQVLVSVQGVQQELRNAGSARTKGVEFDLNYRTPIDGLSVNGAVSYMKNRYLDYQASCYRGQSSLECFNQVNRTTGQIALLQDLSGAEMNRSPSWSGNAGFQYETPLASSLMLGLSGNMTFSSDYLTDALNNPLGRQKSFQTFDAAVRLFDNSAGWEVALIGRNLTEEFYFVKSGDVAFTGTDPGLVPGGGTFGDVKSAPNRGREIRLRVSFKFGG